MKPIKVFIGANGSCKYKSGETYTLVLHPQSNWKSL